MQTETLHTRAQALAGALAFTRSAAAKLVESLDQIDSAVAGLGGLEIPSIARSIRANGNSRSIRNAISALNSALDHVAEIVRDARAAPYTDQRPTGVRAAA